MIKFAIYKDGNSGPYVLSANRGLYKIGRACNLANKKWQWVHGVGCLGVWITRNKQIAEKMASGLNIKIEYLQR